MANQIRGIDHVLIAASDLERSAEIWRRLGFVTTPYGRHVGKSTANYCIMFAKDYVELIGIVDPASPPSQHNDLIAVRGDGLFATALSPDSAETARQAVIDAGIEALPLRDLHRAVERPDGTADLYFKNFDLADAATPDYRFFFCHHLTPDEMRHPDWLAHPNGVVGVDGIVVVCPGPAAHADAYAKLFGGDAVGVDDGVLTIRAGRHRARFMTDAAFRAAYSAAKLPPAPAAAYGASVGFLVRDVAATAAWLDRAGVAHVRTDGGILVAPGEATGVLVQFRAAA